MHGHRLVLELEKRLLYRRIAIALVLALVALAALHWTPGIGGPVIVEQYEFNATVTGDPSSAPVYLTEHYTYRVAEGEYHMLYRSWPLPAYTWSSYPCCARGAILAGVTCPPGMKPYIVGPNGDLTLLADATPEEIADAKARVQEARATNEAGCYSRAPLEPGEYDVSYTWVLFLPPADGRSGQAVLPLAIEGEHVDYANATGVIRGNATEIIVGLAPAPVRWSSALIPLGARVGPVSIDQGQGLVAALSIEGNEYAENYADRAELAFRSEEIMTIAGVLGALAVPALAIISYYTRGVEPAPGPIPEGAPPRTGEKPWIVNVLYHGQPGVATFHAVAATIIDLLRRGVLRLEHGPEGPSLVLPGTLEGLDWYESRVVQLLREAAGGDRLPVQGARRLLHRKGRRLRSEARDLFRGRRLGELARQAHEPGGRGFAFMAAVFLFIAVPLNLATAMGLPLHDDNMALKTMIANTLAALSSITIATMPSHVLGRWRRGYLERYAAWQLFAEQYRDRPPLSLEEAAYLVALGRDREILDSLRGAEGIARAVEEAISIARELAVNIAAASGAAAAHGGGGGGGGGAGAR